MFRSNVLLPYSLFSVSVISGIKQLDSKPLPSEYATSQKASGSRPVNIFNLPNPSGLLRPGVDSASNRNEYQKQENNVSGE
jgi:hypothetical protein